MAERELSSSPSLAVLYPKAMAGAALPLVRKLPGIGGPPRELPDTELVLPDVEIDSERLAEYCRVCTFEIRDTLPATFPHILAFPLSLQLMSDSSFPFPMIGLVHVGNRIELRRPIGVDERLTLRVRMVDLRPHERGTQFDVAAEALVGDESVWTSASTYLRREGGGSSSGLKQRSEPPKPESTFAVPDDIGRRYAAVSGDRNPIHLHPLSARLFGMPKPIAHGMWTKARCLALMQGTLPDSYTVEVSFKLPIFLPARVGFSRSGESFAVHDAESGKPHLSGTVR